MRVGRQKRQRKTVRFYTACFGFREPFKILLDGTFVHHLILHALLPLDRPLSSLLSSRRVTLFTTTCVCKELKSLGHAHVQTLRSCERLKTARCDHQDHRVDGSSCIASIVGQDNPEHFFVATQDSDLRKLLREIPGVPVIFGLKKSLFLEQPSENQRQFVKSAEESRMHMTESEYKMLISNKKELKRKPSILVSENSTMQDNLENEAQIEEDATNIRSTSKMLETSKFKRKRPKNPNPLSCKKKSITCPSNAKDQGGRVGNGTSRKRLRKRKRLTKDVQSELTSQTN
ncbi:hypothetical protein QJS04_geneDACA019252 [Acorus gramineus]|uniref:UTP23 sensor motif region domain-containing protein n=1 Tax=Acorus gramineus TaxID=55184 RepID=A0AAV8ZW07_ACOGR|nr:hypothetical protein QJS04_geneDACA019252 [Acorus gramineus]